MLVYAPMHEYIIVVAIVVVIVLIYITTHREHLNDPAVLQILRPDQYLTNQLTVVLTYDPTSAQGKQDKQNFDDTEAGYKRQCELYPNFLYKLKFVSVKSPHNLWFSFINKSYCLPSEYAPNLYHNAYQYKTAVMNNYYMQMLFIYMGLLTSTFYNYTDNLHTKVEQTSFVNNWYLPKQLRFVAMAHDHAFAQLTRR